MEMAISAEQWAKIEEDLKSLDAYAQFRLDGHDLFVRWLNMSKNGQVYALIVGIDGFIPFGAGYPSMASYDPFTEKVWRKRIRTISLFKKHKYDGKSKRAIAELNSLKKQFPDKVEVRYEPFFPTEKALIRQYRKLEGLEFSKRR